MNTYVIYAITAIILFGTGFIGGCQHEQSAQEKVIRQKEHQYQAAADEIRKAKDAQINAINNQLADALVSLRNRPSRTTETGNRQNCNGTGLYAEDAEFLIREATRADQIRIALQSCYQQYDSIK